LSAVQSSGKEVAALLKRAWRVTPPPPEISPEQFAGTAPLLLKSGAGALGWWRIRQSSLCSLPEGQLLRIAYLECAAQAIEHERKIATLAEALNREKFSFILLKGSATSRFYPESHLRPSGDIDLYMPSREWIRVRAILDRRQFSGYRVDLVHVEFERFDVRSFEEFYQHAESIRVGGAEVKMLGTEDHLRFLCLHLLKHGGWRPLWLCDIAALLERLPERFDWDRCLGPNELYAVWILCTIGLAQDILRAEVSNPPPFLQDLALPRWLVNSILNRWSNPNSPDLSLFVDQVRHCWRQPRRLIEALWERWPNPIQATVDADGPFDDRARLPFQLRNYKSRAVELGRQMFTRP